MALSESLSVGVRIAYLDKSDLTSQSEVINWVEFGNDTTEENQPLTLLYRPGHFDVVTKDAVVQNAMARGR